MDTTADNRCTYWLNGWPWGSGDEWLHCCVQHDAAYGPARHFGEYLAAHWELCRCVAEVSPVMAAIMLAGVAAGTLFFGLKKLPDWYWRR